MKNKQRKNLSQGALLEIVRASLKKLSGSVNGKISTRSCIMAGLAVFNFKYPSLLQFDRNARGVEKINNNLINLYKIPNVPCDTYMRERLDEVEPWMLSKAFKGIFAAVQRGKLLESYSYIDGHYLLSIDGTGQYYSENVSCVNCCEKHHHNGEISYYHQLLGAVLVHPECKIVIPLAPEPIIKADGNTKNDCEINAAKRLLTSIRREHPHLKLIIVEDSLYSNGPHIALLQALGMKFIIGVKPNNHKYLFDWIAYAKCEEFVETDASGKIRHYKFLNGISLNDTYNELLVNFLEYTETSKAGVKLHFSWITDIKISKGNVYQIMKGGRARWRIENETFNTLKNQGYNFEHNYGHGNKNLCSVFSMLMMLAFLMDEVQKLCCDCFKRAKAKAGTYKKLWQTMLFIIEFFIIDSWQALYSAIGTSTAPDTS